VTRLLLAKGANPSVLDNHGVSPIYVAAQKGHTAALQLLLGAAGPKLQINAPISSGVSPLGVAAWQGKIEAALLLMDHGADPMLRMTSETVQEVNGKNAIEVALAQGHASLVDVIQKRMEARSSQEGVDSNARGGAESSKGPTATYPCNILQGPTPGSDSGVELIESSAPPYYAAVDHSEPYQIPRSPLMGSTLRSMLQRLKDAILALEEELVRTQLLRDAEEAWWMGPPASFPSSGRRRADRSPFCGI
jgi:hypothetical protein